MGGAGVGSRWIRRRRFGCARRWSGHRRLKQDRLDLEVETAGAEEGCGGLRGRQLGSQTVPRARGAVIRLQHDSEAEAHAGGAHIESDRAHGHVGRRRHNRAYGQPHSRSEVVHDARDEQLGAEDGDGGCVRWGGRGRDDVGRWQRGERGGIRGLATKNVRQASPASGKPPGKPTGREQDCDDEQAGPTRPGLAPALLVGPDPSRACPRRGGHHGGPVALPRVGLDRAGDAMQRGDG